LIFTNAPQALLSIQGAQAKMALTKLTINSNLYYQTTQFMMIFIERWFLFSFNPNLALQMLKGSYAHFCPNQGFKFRPSGQFTGSSGHESDSPKGPHELKQAQEIIYIFSPMV